MPPSSLTRRVFVGWRAIQKQTSLYSSLKPGPGTRAAGKLATGKLPKPPGKLPGTLPPQVRRRAGLAPPPARPAAAFTMLRTQRGPKGGRGRASGAPRGACCPRRARRCHGAEPSPSGAPRGSRGGSPRGASRRHPGRLQANALRRPRPVCGRARRRRPCGPRSSAVALLCSPASIWSRPCPSAARRTRCS